MLLIVAISGRIVGGVASANGKVCTLAGNGRSLKIIEVHVTIMDI